jgi:hypothetical protein
MAQVQTEKPTALRPSLLHIPKTLTALDQWVMWRYEWREGKWTKVPYRAGTRDLTEAKSNDPSTWSSFADAFARFDVAGCDGIGFVVTVECRIVGIDLDHCRDPKTGELNERAQFLIRRFASYIEVSPSGTGIRIFVFGALPEGRRKVGDYEVYAKGRYLTVTGHHVEDTPTTIEERSEALAAMVKWLGEDRRDSDLGAVRNRTAPKSDSASVTGWLHLNADDAELLTRARQASNGADFEALWRGDISGHDNDDSRADLALCNHLAFWTGKDAVAMDRLFRQSGLYREKWERKDYRDRTIAEAISGTTEVYEPGGEIRHGAAAQALVTPATNSTARPWPDPISEDAFLGLAGEVTQTIEPHSEADPVAILLQFLVLFGNVIGHRPHFIAENDRHALNLYLLLVGDTSIARKGASFGQGRRVFDLAIPRYGKECVESGLATGEGLITRVRDPITTIVKSGERKTTDFGVEDKRVVWFESEFASVLKVMQWSGATLSQKLRLAWDSGDLGSATKNSPVHATGAHISVIGHITRQELMRCLDRTEVANGLVNRFLVARVKRSKELPEGGTLGDDDLATFRNRLKAAIDFAGKVDLIKRDEQATRLFIQHYHDLTLGRPGLLGAVVARGAPLVMRLAAIESLLNLSSSVGVDHLKAGLAIWRYCFDSARSIFGDLTGDPTADDLLLGLRRSTNGMTGTDIRNYFGRNKSAADIERAQQVLLDHGLAEAVAEKTGGRDATRWLPRF